MNYLTNQILAVVRRETGHADASLDDSLDDLGLDSLELVALLQSIADEIGFELPAGRFAEIETLNDLVRAFSQEATLRD